MKVMFSTDSFFQKQGRSKGVLPGHLCLFPFNDENRNLYIKEIIERNYTYFPSFFCYFMHFEEKFGKSRFKKVKNTPLLKCSTIKGFQIFGPYSLHKYFMRFFGTFSNCIAQQIYKAENKKISQVTLVFFLSCVTFTRYFET